MQSPATQSAQKSIVAKMKFLAMSSRMLIFIVTVLVITLGATAITTTSLKVRGSRRAAQASDKYIVVDTEQLPPDNGTFPVEVRCGTAYLPAPDTLEPFSCMVINNTEKYISALSAAYTVITEKGGKESTDIGFLNSDSFIHPDVREARRLKMIAPRASSALGPAGSVTYENAIVKSVGFRIDYVEFEDKTSLGANVKGKRIIDSMREGAAKYKEWLAQTYAQKRDLENALVPLLEDGEIPKGLKLDGLYQEEGASIYRKVMRGVYRTRGAAALEKYLSR